MRRAVLFTSHFHGSPRRAGFHWISLALRRQGWHVTFVTVGFSHLSRLRRDHRFAYALREGANRAVVVDETLTSYVWFTPYHPVNRLPPLANRLLAPLFRRYGRLPAPGLQELVTRADLVLFESTSGLMLFDRVVEWAPDARLVYRMSDDLRMLRAHPAVLFAERSALDRFDLVSVPSESMLAGFPGLTNIRAHPHGIETDPFDRPSTDPYDRNRAGHAIFVGMSHLDRDFLRTAASSFPAWDFHVVGPLGDLPDLPNIVAHGELAFADTVPFIVHADIGLATREAVAGAETLRDSLKVIQYTYARLPVIAPDFMASERPNVITYVPNDPTSIRAAMDRAAAFDRSTISRDAIWSWDRLARVLAGDEPG